MPHTLHSRRKKGFAAVALSFALLASSCGSDEKTSSTTGAPDTTAAGDTTPVGDGTIKEGLKVYFIPKDTLNPYEVIADEGGAMALEELGGEVIVSSGTEATAAAQIPSIQAAIADNADAIVIAGNDPDALCPSIAQAQEAGIKIISFDSDINCPDHLFINQADTEGIGRSQVDLLASQIGSEGEIAILSAAATATNQNAWIDFMKLQLEEKYPNMTLVEIVYGNDDPATSLTVLQGLLSAYPNLKGIISPTTVGISTAAQYFSTHPEVGDKIVLTGLGLPSQMREYIKDGTLESFALWNPSDLGYLAGYAAAALASDVYTITDGATFNGGKLGDYTVTVPAEGSPFVVLGLPQVFDLSNIDDFDF